MKKQFLATVATIALMAGSAHAESISAAAEKEVETGLSAGTSSKAAINTDTNVKTDLDAPADVENKTTPSLKGDSTITTGTQFDSDADGSMTKTADEENRTSPSLKTTGETSAEAVVNSAVDGAKEAVDTVAEGTEAVVGATVDTLTINEDIEGATVYGANGEASGEVDRVIANADGKIEAYVVDVGGFLGIGEKPVAISSANIDIRTDADGDLSVYTPFTKEQLEAQPEFTDMAYRSAPESVIMTVPSTQ